MIDIYDLFIVFYYYFFLGLLNELVFSGSIIYWNKNVVVQVNVGLLRVI